MKRFLLLFFLTASTALAANPTIRYFATTGAGAADGTSHANRAALFSSGNWSTVITGFNFTTDAMEARIETGSYTCSQSLASGLFSNAPTNANPLVMVAADSSGNILAVPNPAWTSPQPDWDTSNMPVINTTSDINMFNLANVQMVLLKITATSGRNGTLVGQGSTHWCYVSNATANSAAVASSVSGYNCIYKCSGSSYSAVTSSSTLYNTRVEGVAGSSGNRNGIATGSTTSAYYNCTVVNNGGSGVVYTGSNAAQNIQLHACTIANNGVSGLKSASTASQTSFYIAENSIITGNTPYGIDMQSAGRLVVTNCHLRSNATADFNGTGNYPTDMNVNQTSGTDADEYLATGSSDFSIRANSAIWGKGYGAGDQKKPNGFFVQ